MNGQPTDPELVRDAARGAVWESNRQLAADLLAARRFNGLVPAGDMDPVEERACANLSSVIDLREDLRRSSSILGEPLLLDLVEGFFRLPQNPDALRRAQSALARSPELIRLTRLLFGSPFWDVGEAAASVIAPLMSERPELGPLIRELLGDRDWHVRYSAFDAAYFCRTLDGGRLLEEALQSRHLDESAWVRGLWPLMVRAVFIAHPERFHEAVRRYTPQITILLNDRDVWPLAEIGMLVGYLAQMGCDVRDLVGGGVSHFLGDPSEWQSFGRHEMFDRLERRRRATKP